MLFNRKFMILAIFLVSLLAISAVSAEDNATGDIVSMDDNDDITEVDSDSSVSNEETNRSSFGYFAWNFFNESTREIHVDRDYVYKGPETYKDEYNVTHTLVDENGIYINHSVTIYGHGHEFDANDSARIFNILGSNVVLKDIVFVNGRFDGDGGAILWTGRNGAIDNCTFKDCYAGSDGGAFYMINGTTISDCNFKNCSAGSDGGAVYFEGNAGKITESNFINCAADYAGGAVYMKGNESTISSCYFKEDYAKNRAGAIYLDSIGATVLYCSFNNCSNEEYPYGGGAIVCCAADNIVSDCYFADFKSNWGSAIVWEAGNGTLTNCNFKNCTESGGGVVYWKGENGTITDCRFTDCFDYGGGTGHAGAIYMIGKNCIVANCNFENCHSQNGAGTVYWGAINGIVDNCNFTNCFIRDNDGLIEGEGGAIVWTSTLNGTISNCNFDNCYARAAGAISWAGGGSTYWDGSSWIPVSGTIYNCNFTNCFAKMEHDLFVSNVVGCAGAILWKNYYGNISDCNFINCSADRSGGAMLIRAPGDTNVDNCNFVDCSAGAVGGAISFEDYGSFYVNGGSFTNCHANDNGGAIRGTNKLNVHNSDFTNCSANGTYGGGAISDGYAVNCTFINNSATGITWGGGALSDCSAANCTFIDNYANMNGGAIRSGSAVNSTFINNHANTYGGAISDGSAVNSIFINNSAIEGYGGAIAKGGAENCSFTNCYAKTFGGAIGHEAYNEYYTVANCNFTNCLALNRAGAVAGSGIHATAVINCSFINNSAVNGYAGAVEFCDARNSTFIDNSANTTGGAMYGATAKDCTFYGNKAKEGNNWYDTSVPKLYLVVSNFNSTYGFGEAVFLNATDKDGIAVSNVIITIRVYKNDTLIGTYDCLTNTDWLVGLDAGNYTAEMAVEHHAYVLNNPVKIKLTIAKMPTSITSADVSTVYNSDDYLVVTLKDIKGNPVGDVPISVDLNGAANYTTDENGTVKVSTKGLDANTYSAAIAFEGNNNYDVSSASVNVTVAKGASVVSSDAVTTVYNGGKYLIVTLKDVNGNPISGAKISVNINGAKTITTGSDGKAKLTTDGYAPKTSYTAKINFAGDGNYNASSTTAKVTVKKATVKLTAKAKSFKKSVKTKKYTVTLKTNQNKVMKNTKVTIKVNKKTYSAKTNSKGVATFKITKLTKKGKYTATVTYKGSSYYNKLTKKVKITVK